MMRFTTIPGGRLLTGETAYGDFDIAITTDHDGPIFDRHGNQIGTLRLVMRTPTPSLPPQRIEAGYDPASLKRGGCCDPPKIDIGD